MAEIGKYCKGFIEAICSKFGARTSCSQQARDAAEFIQEEMNKYCNKIETEEFTGYPAFFKPYLGYPMLTTLFYFTGLVLYFFIPILAIILGIIAIYASVFKIFSLEEYDFFYYIYPRRKGINVIGKIKPKRDSKKLVILGSHHDSPYYFPLFWKLRNNITYFVYLLFVFAFLFYISVIYKLISQITIIIFFPLEFLIIVPIIGGAFILIFGLFFISHYKTLGANDNLSAVSICLGVAKELSKNGLNETEVWIISFDAEESGMRGSKTFVQKRLEFLKTNLTACINFDIVGVDENIILPTKETMYRATHSPEVYNKYKEAADSLQIPIEIKKVSFGGTDSAPFSRAGLNAASVLRFSETGWPSIWHSKNDIPKNIKEEKLEEIVKISLEFLSLIDKE